MCLLGTLARLACGWIKCTFVACTAFRTSLIWRPSFWTIQAQLWRHNTTTVLTCVTRLAWRASFTCVTFHTFSTSFFRLFTFFTSIAICRVWLSTFRVACTWNAWSLLGFVLILSWQAWKAGCLPSLLLWETRGTSNTRRAVYVVRRTILSWITILTIFSNFTFEHPCIAFTTLGILPTSDA